MSELAILDQYQERCYRILEWSNENPGRSFDSTLIENVLCQITDAGFVTERQRRAVDEIIERFEILM